MARPGLKVKIVGYCRIVCYRSIYYCVLLVHSVYEELMFYLSYLFLYFFSLFCFLLALRSQNQRSDTLWVCYEQLGEQCNFNIL